MNLGLKVVETAPRGERDMVCVAFFVYFNSVDLLKTSSVSQHNCLHFVAEDTERHVCPPFFFAVLVVLVGRISVQGISSVCLG